jgi:hypothetical protein
MRCDFNALKFAQLKDASFSGNAAEIGCVYQYHASWLEALDATCEVLWDFVTFYQRDRRAINECV